MDVPLTILFLMACGFTTHTKGSNSLQLTSSPATALPDQPYTLMCSSSGSTGRTREWHWRNDVIFRSSYVSDTHCPVNVANNYNYRDLSGRVNLTCSHNQYNVTLRILTSIDNGSVWWCEDTVRSQESNRLTIRVVNIMTMISTTTTVATTATAEATTTTTSTTSTTTITATTTMPVISAANATTTAAAKSDITSSKSPQRGGVVNIMAMSSTTTTVSTTATAEATTTTTATTSTTDISSSKSPQGGGGTYAGSQVAFIAAGVGGGGAVVIVVVVSVLFIRRRRGRPVNNGSAHAQKHEASHTYYNENHGLQDQDINDKVQVENDIYETSLRVTSPNQPSTNDHVITDVYAQVQKQKKPTGTADDINMEDLYAKPDKTKTMKKQED